MKLTYKKAETRFYSENYKAFERLANEIKIELQEKDELVERLSLENENYKRILESQNSNPSQVIINYSMKNFN